MNSHLKILSRLEYYRERLFKLLRPKATGIERMVYGVTYRCNSRCIMCNIWKDEHPVHQELTIDDLKNVFLREPLLKNLAEVGLTGGEPYLRGDLDEIVIFFIKNFRKAKVSINTNGLLGDRICEKTLAITKGISPEDINRIRISFSVDGIKDVHDRVRGISGNYQKVLDIIGRLREGIPGIEYGMTFTVLPDNYDQVWDVYLLSKELKVGFSFSMAQVSGIYYENSEKTFLYTPAMLRKIEEQIQAILKDNPEYGNYYYCKMIDYNRNPRQYVSCYAGYNSFFLDPYGNVYPCLLLDSSFGNIKDKPFEKVWESNEAEKTRRRIKESRCHCWGCESEISFRRSWKVLFWSLIKRFLGYKVQR